LQREVQRGILVNLQFDVRLPGGLESLLSGSDQVMPGRQLGDGVETGVRGDSLANQVCADILNLDGGPGYGRAAAVGNRAMKCAIDGLCPYEFARQTEEQKRKDCERGE